MIFTLTGSSGSSGSSAVSGVTTGDSTRGGVAGAGGSVDPAPGGNSGA